MQQDKKIIDRLRNLKYIELDKNAVHHLKKTVYLRSNTIRRQEELPAKKHILQNFYIGSGIIVALLLLIILGFPEEIAKTIVMTKIAFAQNQYQKAQIAFAYTKVVEHKHLSNRELSDADIHSLSESLLLVNNELSKLMLKGEKGKYTQKECQQLYYTYNQYLESMEVPLINGKIKTADQKTKMFLEKQIATYEKESQQKLNIYK